MARKNSLWQAGEGTPRRQRIFCFWKQERPGSICRMCRKKDQDNQDQEPEQGQKSRWQEFSAAAKMQPGHRPSGLRYLNQSSAGTRSSIPNVSDDIRYLSAKKQSKEGGASMGEGGDLHIPQEIDSSFIGKMQCSQLSVRIRVQGEDGLDHKNK